MFGNREDHNRLVYIEIPETSHSGYADLCRENAEKGGMEFVHLEGSLSLLRDFIYGDWKEENFLILKPGEKSVGLYDWDRVIGSEAKG